MQNLAELFAGGLRKPRNAGLLLACLAALSLPACGRTALLPVDGAVHTAGAAAPDAAPRLDASKPCRWLGFWPQATYPTSGEPTFLTVADFDRDGSPDVAVSIADQNAVGIFRNLGHGSFASQTSLSGVTSPNGIVSADFDGDGFPDLAVTGGASAAHAIAVFTNLRDGSFASPAFYEIDTSRSRAGFVAAGDLNGDGHVDLVATSSAANLIAVLLNAGNGSLLPATTVGLSHANRLVLADLDSDGVLDLAATGWGGAETFTSVFNDGHGRLKIGSTYSSTESGCCFVDLVAGKFSSTATDIFTAGPHNLTFFANDGHGRFTGSGKSMYTAPGLAAADFNKDGVLDLAVTTDTALRLMLDPGDGQLRDPDYSFALGSSPRGIAAADFDGDGYPDVAVADAGFHTISVLLSRCE